MDKRHRIGIVGYGWVAGAHIEAIQQCAAAEVVAVYSSRELSAQALGAAHGGEIRAYADLDAMLADDSIDVVSICSYPNQHREQAVAAARAGKHLIIEKPLALSMADCRAIAAAAAEAGVQVCVCFECRYSSQFLTTKAVIDQGLLGEIHYGEVDYYHGIGPWYGQYRWNTTRENGGSSLLSAGCHAMDALLLCMGAEVESVTSSSTVSRNSDFARYEYPTTSVTIVNFSDGRVGKVASVIDCLQPYYFHTHLVGSEGSLLDKRFHSTKLGGLDKAVWSELSMKLLDSGDVSDHPYQTQFEAFFSALGRGEAMALTSLADAMKSFEVIFAADLSAAEKRKVELSEIRG
jgi:predicted dehydrogenase